MKSNRISSSHTSRSLLSRGPRRRSGFTLTDLVVGVGILTLLAGIGFPGLGRAREEAKKTKCLSNLRQLGLGSHGARLRLGRSGDAERLG